MDPKELKALIEKDKQARLNEMQEILQEAAERLNVEIKAVIEVSPSGESALAKLVINAK